MAEKLYKMTPDGSFEPVETPTEVPAEDLRHIETPSGFAWDIDPVKMDDMRIVEDLAAIDNGEIYRVLDVLQRLIGKDGKDALYAHLQTEDGRVPVSAFVEELDAIIHFLGADGKK